MKTKELVKRLKCGCEVFNGIKATLCDKHAGYIPLDRFKPKELDWEKEYRKLLKEYQVNAEDWDCFPDLGVKFINTLLTQQRTELLEEIEENSFWRGYKAGMYKMSKSGDCGELVPKTDKTIKVYVEEEIEPKLLLNKKDE